MELKRLPHDLSICKVGEITQIDLSADFCFICKTDEELSLVCRTHDVPKETLARDDGWKGFRICGVLDFSLIGILANLTSILAQQGIGVFAVSTYNTDYILVKAEDFERASSALAASGYGMS
ncbi:MAG: ACT domain-containing protein [Oscillospiraceae bacterium]|nr:ACT domain-containing protein [Oscillospiraceae bacterium]